MPRLVDRNRQIPGGYIFRIPALGWQSTPWASFDSITRSAIGALQGNPSVAQRLGWDLSYDAMANRIDEFNASVCKHMGWTDYYVEGGSGGAAAPAPFPQPNLLSRLGNLAVGGKTLVKWINSGAEAVPKDQAEKRASICSECPLNERGDWLSLFTLPAAEAIRKEIGRKREWKLETANDHLLGSCEACDCPMILKVHVPIKTILEALKPEQRQKLHPKCWILSES